jgi:hypothetical protein
MSAGFVIVEAPVIISEVKLSGDLLMTKNFSPFPIYLAEGLTTYFTPDDGLMSSDSLEELLVGEDSSSAANVGQVLNCIILKSVNIPDFRINDVLVLREVSSARGEYERVSFSRSS